MISAVKSGTGSGIFASIRFDLVCVDEPPGPITVNETVLAKFQKTGKL